MILKTTALIKTMGNHCWSSLQNPTCSLCLWMTNGVGIVITIYLLTCCAIVYSKSRPALSPNFIVEPANGMKNTGSLTERFAMPWQQMILNRQRDWLMNTATRQTSGVK